MLKRSLVFICFVSIALFLFQNQALSGTQPEEKIPQESLSKDDIFAELELFADAITLINANYVKETKPKELIYGALDGMLSSLDSHSSFLTPEELEEMRTETRGEFGGIGIKVTMRDKILTVVSPLEDTPAYKAGIQPGDKVIEIDGDSTKDYTLDDVVKRLRGVPGTEVKLTILREGEEKLISVLVKRAMIKLKSVKPPLLLDDKIGYIRIVEFQQYTAVDLNRALKELRKKGMKALILDLRSNPGGLLSSAVSVSEKFLEKDDPILTTKGRIEQQNMEFKSSAIKPYTGFPIAVLINKGSASASEIVAGALRDNKRAVTVGEKSFGKGSVQTVIPMKDNSALRLTTSFYYTPSGKIIHEKGIVPDVEVQFKRPEQEKTEEPEGAQEEKEEEQAKEERYTPKREKELLLLRVKEDNQVQAATEVLKDTERYNSILKA